MDDIRHEVSACSKCGSEYVGKSACGIGREKKGVVFLIGMNPWTENGKFKNGRGITMLLDRLKGWEFEDYFFDNVVKCEMPNGRQPTRQHAQNCKEFLFRQVTLLAPMYQVLFGQFAAEHMGFKYSAWVEWQDPYTESSKVVTVPHFSSILYGSTKKKIEDYYMTLHDVLKKARQPQQRRLF